MMIYGCSLLILNDLMGSTKQAGAYMGDVLPTSETLRRRLPSLVPAAFLLWIFRTTTEQRMYLTALSNGATIRAKKLDLPGLGDNFICVLAGIPPTRLTRCLNGIEDLRPEDAHKIHVLLDSLLALQKSIRFPLTFRNPEKFQIIFDQLQHDDITVEMLVARIEKAFAK